MNSLPTGPQIIAPFFSLQPALVDVLCTRSDKEIAEIKARYQASEKCMALLL